MTPPNIVVVGGGIAGTAAAMTARLSGASVVLMHAHGGASALSSGALDLLPWGTSQQGEPLDDWDRRVLHELGLYTFPSRGALVATCAGILRPALGHDDAIADIASWRTGTTLVPTFPAQGWNGRLLAGSLQDSSMGHDLSMHFATTSVELDHVPPSLIMTGSAPAVWHDETSHLRALGEALRKVIDDCEVRPVGILLPPWLGVARPRAQQLSSHLGIPCGEVLSEPGQAAGFRFESARDRALERLEVKVFEEAVQTLEPTGEGWKVIGASGTTLECQGVLLALGGLLGGGLTFRPPSEGRLSLGPRANLNTPFGLPLGLGLDGTPIRDSSSLHGLPGHTWLRPTNAAASLERLGIQCNPDGFPLFRTHDDGASGPSPRAFRAAGECVAGVPRTWLASMRSGIRAGRSLCDELL